jgi:hypothetical protein
MLDLYTVTCEPAYRAAVEQALRRYVYQLADDVLSCDDLPDGLPDAASVASDAAAAGVLRQPLLLAAVLRDLAHELGIDPPPLVSAALDDDPAYRRTRSLP